MQAYSPSCFRKMHFGRVLSRGAIVSLFFLPAISSTFAEESHQAPRPQFRSFAEPIAAAPSCPSSTGTGHNYAGQDLTDHNFSADPAGSLVGANFKGAKLSGAVFAGQDLTNASFESAKLDPSIRPVDFTSSKLANTCFIGAVLDETDFTYADITCADFSYTSLMKATFGPIQNIHAGGNCRTKFVGATLDVHLISNDASGRSNWSQSDFTAANFQNLSPSTFNLRGKDITGAILKLTSFIGIDMTGANLTDVDFSKAVLTKAKLDQTAINGAKFYNAQAGSATFICAQAYGNSGGKKLPDNTPCPPAPTSSDSLKPVDFTFAGLSNATFTAATLDHAIFAGANLNTGTLPNSSLVQANLQATDTPDGPSGPANVQFALFSNTDFTNAQLGSVVFSGGVLTSAIFDNTTLNGTTFNSAIMPDASFITATLQSVDFSGANLQAAKFNGVRVHAPSGGGFAAHFTCAQLGGANFKDAVIAAADFGNAVMPADSDCCPASKGGQPWCGVVDATQQTYGPVTFPILNSPSTCPNGDTGQCMGDQWRLSGNWVTRGCNPNKVPQTMWSKPNCGGKPGDIVVFKDPNLKRCILATLPGQTEVLVASAQQIIQVDCPNLGISDLGGLENFISLTRLNLSGNELTFFNLSFVSGGSTVASNLQSLDLSGNKLTTLDLTNHPNLISLEASNNQLGAILLNANAAPVYISASHNKLAAFDLSIQTSLAYADFSYNNLSSVLDDYNHDLSNLTGLSYLDLSHNALKTIGSINSLAYNKVAGTGGSLRSLSLACNPDFQCSDLGIYDGTNYPAASTSLCSAYSTTTGKWTPLRNPSCPPS
ncbi:hypothetical protein DSM21852_35860 [Methylocystis bryophila]|nr:hypothetical protein DSM21852_35860 [Methylocystis bryophila]